MELVEQQLEDMNHYPHLTLHISLKWKVARATAWSLILMRPWSTILKLVVKALFLSDLVVISF